MTYYCDNCKEDVWFNDGISAWVHCWNDQFFCDAISFEVNNSLKLPVSKLSDHEVAIPVLEEA